MPPPHQTHGASPKPPLPWARGRWPGLGFPSRCRAGLGELGSPHRVLRPSYQTLRTSTMESPGNPADPGEAPAQAPGKWALVRSLNQALKTFAVMPVSPGPGGEGSLAWASISGSIRSQAICRS